MDNQTFIPLNEALRTELSEKESFQEHFSISSWLSVEERKELLTKSNIRALSLFIPILLGYLISLFGTLLNLGIIPSLFFSVVAGIILAQLFIIAHESIHNSFAEKNWQNNLISGICFFLTLHSRSLYTDLHINHHKYVNVKELDPNWTPITKSEFDKLSLIGKSLQRLYRSPLGSLPYYLGDYWLKVYFLPIHSLVRSQWKKYIFSSIMVGLAAISQMTLYSYIGLISQPNTPVVQSICWSWLIPILVCFWFISFTFYMQHTNPAIPWFRLKDFSFLSIYDVSIKSCNRTHFPEPIDTMYLDECEHTAHHLLAGIPLYNLKKAQRLFEQRYPNKTIVIPNGFMEFFRVTRICKLYDFDRNCWTDFDGNPTAPPIPRISNDNI